MVATRSQSTSRQPALRGSSGRNHILSRLRRDAGAPDKVEVVVELVVGGVRLDGDGYVAWLADFPAVSARGDDIDSALRSLAEAGRSAVREAVVLSMPGGAAGEPDEPPATWRPEACLTALLSCKAETGKGTQKAYREWAKVRDGVPSLKDIGAVFGTWANAAAAVKTAETAPSGGDHPVEVTASVAAPKHAGGMQPKKFNDRLSRDAKLHADAPVVSVAGVPGRVVAAFGYDWLVPDEFKDVAHGLVIGDAAFGYPSITAAGRTRGRRVTPATVVGALLAGERAARPFMDDDLDSREQAAVLRAAARDALEAQAKPCDRRGVTRDCWHQVHGLRTPPRPGRPVADKHAIFVIHDLRDNLVATARDGR